MKIPEGLPDDTSDWPVPDMLKLAQDNTAWEDERYPSGMKGAVVMFDYTEERVSQGTGEENTGKNPQMYFIAGLNCDEALELLDKVRNRLVLEIIRHEIKYSKY